MSMALFSRTPKNRLGRLLSSNGNAELPFIDQAKATLQKRLTRPRLWQVLSESPPETAPDGAWVGQIIDVMPGYRPQDTLGSSLARSNGYGPVAPQPQDADQMARQRQRAPQNDLRKRITISAVSLGLSLAGLAFPLLGVVGGLGLTYNGFNILKDTYRLLKQGQVTVDVLVSGTVLGCILSGHFIIGNVATLMFQTSLFMLFKVKAEAKNQLVNVFHQAPKFVWVLVDGVEVSLPFDKIEPGQVVIVQAGEIIPADGRVVEGMATVDQHILTGEARPVERGVGEPVFASTVVLSGRICVQVEKAGQETTVAQIGNILNKTTDFKSTVILRSEDLANRTVVPTLLLSAISLPFVGLMGSLGIFDAHFKRKMTLITPISILNYFNIASKQGILIKDGRSLDLLHQVDTIVFDKTGTLTEEQPTVRAIHTCAGYDENEVLQLAAAAEHKQTHPIARAIVTAAQQRRLDIPALADSEYKVGYGLSVIIDGQLIRVGSHRFMEMVNISLPPSMVTVQTACHRQGHSLVLIAVDDCLIGAIELQPTLRPEAKAVIQQLKQRPRIKETYIISGDNEIPTRKLAQDLGIDHYFAETLPEQKADLIDKLQQEGKFICYIGDGINDAIALKKAQVSISLKGASTMATDTAQILLLDQGLSHLNDLFEIAHDFHTNVNTIFGIVLLPTVIGIGGIYLFGFGLAYTVLLNTAGLGMGIGYAMLPRLKYQRQLAAKSKNGGE